MTRSWLVHAAAFIVLWFALAVILGVILGGIFREGGARKLIPPAPVEDDREDRLATHQFEHDMAAGEDRDDH
jgi:hypothetical protein